GNSKLPLKDASFRRQVVNTHSTPGFCFKDLRGSKPERIGSRPTGRDRLLRSTRAKEPESTRNGPANAQACCHARPNLPIALLRLLHLPKRSPLLHAAIGCRSRNSRPDC